MDENLDFVALLVSACIVTALALALWELWRRLKVTATPPATGTPEHRTLALAADGREVFTPEPLLVGRVYRVQVTGVYSFKRGEVSRCADAFHATDEHGNFVDHHNRLFLGNQQLAHVPHIVEMADRDAHAYCFLIDGNGEKFAIALRSLGTCPSGTLRVEVVLLDPAERTVALQREEEAHRAAINKIKQQIAQLRVSSEVNRNWGDPAFVADVSKSRAASLIADQHGIRQHFIALHESNPQLVGYMREHEPDLWARLTGPLEAFLAAERRDAKPTKAGVESGPKEKKPRPTAEQVRARIVRRLTVASDDQKAALKSVLTAWEDKAAILRGFGLEEEEVAEALGTKAEALNDVLSELAERKGGSHATPQQLA
ncbi:MAG TPA: hypothetical protein VGV60_06705 [Candidatus Polarisedimenticolia bacterium]|jgi:hypothetical protein|nr:hypothetical protein [Candidatus Polarisedimenticolia bacterium]